jgi:hypothetical protein
MFTAGVVFAVLAALQVFGLVARAVYPTLGRRMLSYTEGNPFLKHEMAEKNEELKAAMARMEQTPTRGPKIAALLFLALSILFFYFQ